MGELISDMAAEQACLGSLLLRHDLAEEVFAVCPPGEFVHYEPLAHVLADLAGVAGVDLHRVLEELRRRGLESRIGGADLLRLTDRAWAPAHAVDYARDVAHVAKRRLLRESATRAAQMAENPACDLGLAAALLIADAERAGTASGAGGDLATDVLDFVQGSKEFDWLLPGLLETGDRLLFVAGPGVGKSMLLEQIAVMAAAGVHPFTCKPIEPVKTLLVDLEYGDRLLRRRFDDLLGRAARFGRPVKPGMLRVARRPEGIDLCGDDAAWLAGKVAADPPGILVIGPLYKCYRGNVNDEQTARQVTAELDAIRVRHGLALVMEAHGRKDHVAGTRSGDPRGSSLFADWPEFGFQLRPVENNAAVCDVKAFRGQRDERSFPERIRHGGPLAWPWVECEPASEWGVVA